MNVQREGTWWIKLVVDPDAIHKPIWEIGECARENGDGQPIVVFDWGWIPQSQVLEWGYEIDHPDDLEDHRREAEVAFQTIIISVHRQYPEDREGQVSAAMGATIALMCAHAEQHRSGFVAALGRYTTEWIQSLLSSQEVEEAHVQGDQIGKSVIDLMRSGKTFED